MYIQLIAMYVVGARRRRVVRRRRVGRGPGMVSLTGGRRRRRVYRRGAGFFGDLWSGIKNVGRTAINAVPWRDVGNKVNDYLKSNRTISGLVKGIPVVGNVAGNAISSLGYGRRRRRAPAKRRVRRVVRRRRVGGRVYRRLLF
jgi:hypothetical protein